MSERLERAIQEEMQIVEGGYSLGSFNRLWHALTVGNARSGVSFFRPLEFGHLSFDPRRGIVKIGEATCSLCLVDGLDDGQWHNPQTLTYPN